MPNLGSYDVSLKDDYPQCNYNSSTMQYEQTWIYTITKTGDTSKTEISDFEIQLCDNHQVIRASKNGLEAPVVDYEVKDLNIKVFYPPNNNSSCLFKEGEHVRVIKWEGLSNSDVQPNDDPNVGEYNFTLVGCFKKDSINTALKGGNNCYTGTILGPTCEEITPPPRGIDFSNITDIDIIE